MHHNFVQMAVAAAALHKKVATTTAAKASMCTILDTRIVTTTMVTATGTVTETAMVIAAAASPISIERFCSQDGRCSMSCGAGPLRLAVSPTPAANTVALEYGHWTP